eukprot:334695_1
MGGNILLNHISFKDLGTYKTILHGNLFTLHPMHPKIILVSIRDALMIQISINYVTNYLVDFSAIPLDTTELEYSYAFLLEVHDETNINRDRCNDSIQFNAHINDTNTSIIMLFILVLNTINVYDKVRIITDIINDIDTVYE